MLVSRFAGLTPKRRNLEEPITTNSRARPCLWATGRCCIQQRQIYGGPRSRISPSPQGKGGALRWAWCPGDGCYGGIVWLARGNRRNPPPRGYLDRRQPGRKEGQLQQTQNQLPRHRENIYDHPEHRHTHGGWYAETSPPEVYRPAPTLGAQPPGCAHERKVHMNRCITS